jgi:hypothetical protein
MYLASSAVDACMANVARESIALLLLCTSSKPYRAACLLRRWFWSTLRIVGLACGSDLATEASLTLGNDNDDDDDGDEGPDNMVCRVSLKMLLVTYTCNVLGKQAGHVTK